jgi:hypothetical protein
VGLGTIFYCLRFETSRFVTSYDSQWRYSTPPPHGLLTRLSLSLMLRPMVSRPVCLGIKHPSGAYDQIFITVRQLHVWWCGMLSLARGRVCHLQLLLALTSAVIFRSESRVTRDHILLSQIWDFPFQSPFTIRRATVEVLHPTSTRDTHSSVKVKSKLCYDRRSVSQSVLE